MTTANLHSQLQNGLTQRRMRAHDQGRLGCRAVFKRSATQCWQIAATGRRNQSETAGFKRQFLGAEDVNLNPEPLTEIRLTAQFAQANCGSRT